MKRNGDGEPLMKKDCRWLRGDICMHKQNTYNLRPWLTCAALRSLAQACGERALWYEQRKEG